MKKGWKKFPFDLTLLQLSRRGFSSEKDPVFDRIWIFPWHDHQIADFLMFKSFDGERRGAQIIEIFGNKI